MTDLPRIIGHEYDRVENVAHDVIEEGGVGEGAVAAVVAENEQSPEHGALRIIFNGDNED